MAATTIEVRLSESAQEFMAAALDLLQTVVRADPALLEDSIEDAAQRLLDVVERNRGLL
jgi:hypothetical protein